MTARSTTNASTPHGESRMNIFRTISALVLLTLAASAAAERLPVGDFFKDPEFTSVSLSPTGEYITVSVPQGDRTVLAAFRVAGMKLVGKWDYGPMRHIDRVRWVGEERFFMYVSRKLGRFDFRVGTPDVYASNVDGTGRADIPNGGTYQIVDMLWDDPESILVQRSIDTAFLSKMSVKDGRVRTVATAPVTFGSFVVDHEAQARYVVGSEEDNSRVTMRRDGDEWTTVHRSEMGEAMRYPLMFDANNEKVIFSVSDHGEPARLVLLEPGKSGEGELLSRNANVEPGNYLISSDERSLLAVQYLDGLPIYEFIDTEHAESKLYAGLIKAFPQRAVAFGGISRDGRYVLIRAYSDVDPGSFYLFDRDTGKARFLLAAMDWIDPDKMSPMRPISLTARDGTMLPGATTGRNPSEAPLAAIARCSRSMSAATAA